MWKNYRVTGEKPKILVNYRVKIKTSWPIPISEHTDSHRNLTAFNFEITQLNSLEIEPRCRRRCRCRRRSGHLLHTPAAK